MEVRSADDNFVVNDIVHFDKLHNVIHILNKLDNIKLNFHHHHGPDNDILIHHHDGAEYHEHDVRRHDHDNWRNDYDKYGPSDHHHGNRGDDDDLSAAVDHDNYVG